MPKNKTYTAVGNGWRHKYKAHLAWPDLIESLVIKFWFAYAVKRNDAAKKNYVNSFIDVSFIIFTFVAQFSSFPSDK